MTRVTSAVLVCLLVPATAFASLGGTVSTVETDRVQMKSALVGITARGPYTVHTMRSPTGTMIREYYGATGVVFGVAWEGSWQPDLRQLFGTYFDQYERAVQGARAEHKARGRVAIDDGNMVVHISGHLRSISGFAYVKPLIPQAVDPGVIR